MIRIVAIIAVLWIRLLCRIVAWLIAPDEFLAFTRSTTDPRNGRIFDLMYWYMPTTKQSEVRRLESAE